MRHDASRQAGPAGFRPGEAMMRRASDDHAARFAPGSYNQQSRTIDAVFSTGVRIPRWGVYEELAISADAVDLSRVALGQVRLLDSHNQWARDAVLGVVETAAIDNDRLIGTIRFADTEAGREAEGMVLRGEMTGLSVGYRVRTWTLVSKEDETEVWRADKWELLEVSLVSVPADPQAQFRAAPAEVSNRAAAHHERADDMSRTVTAPAAEPADPAMPPADGARAADPAPAAPAADQARVAQPAAPAADPVAAERARAAEIVSIGTRAGMTQNAIDAAIRDGLSVDVFRARAFDHMAAQTNRGATPGLSVGRDETQTRLEQLTDALTIRIGGAAALRHEATGAVREPVGGASEFVRCSLPHMAAMVLGERRMPEDARQREEVLRRAMHTTTDFPVIFEGAINRVLAARYQVAPQTYRAIAARRNFRDFRPHQQIRTGDFPMLQKVGESGEIKFGSFGESKEVVAVAPYAVQFAISRRMLIDDNIGAIDQTLGSYGDMVSRFEENTFYAMKGTVGPVLLEDNKAVFHADHGNLAGAGAAINVTSLGAARAAMRKQKNQSGTLLNVTARILLVGPDKETEAEMAVAAVTPTQRENVNPFSKKLEVVTGPYTGNAWELYADPAVLPVWVWGMLDGYTAPRLRIENPFGVQGVGVSLEHDFGCGAIDFRGAYRNPGA